MRTYKVMLHPTNVQNTRLFQFAGSARYAYNWAIDQQKTAYAAEGKFIPESELRKQFTQHKRLTGNEWMYTISNNVFKQSLRDCCLAYQCFFQHKGGYPRYKSKKRGNYSFYQDTAKIRFTATRVRIEMLSAKRKKGCWVKLAETGRIPVDCNYYNPRIIYDGLHWWVSVAVEVFERKPITISYGEPIGIDLGVKELAVVSDGTVYKNINKAAKVKRIEKKKCRLQRRISRKYEMNKEGKRYKKTGSLIKSEKFLKKIYQRLSRIRQDYVRQVVLNIIRQKPRRIVMENLNVRGMMKNKHLSKAIQDSYWGLFKQLVEYKASMLGISMIVADRFYPSSKTCSKCGHIKSNLKLSDRIYKCEHCGLVLDRDLNAAINLKKYSETY